MTFRKARKNTEPNHAPENEYSREAKRDEYSQTRKSRGRKKILTTAGVIALILVLVCAGAGFAFVSSIGGKLNKGVNDDLLSALADTARPEDPFYMLLLGVDKSQSREKSDKYAGDSFRSDSMILTRVDPQERKVTMVSLHRDTMIDMGKNGVQKLNAAHAIGGPAYTVKVVSEMAGVPISHYAEIDFDGFKAAVDALGGVEVDVPMAIDDSHVGGHVDAGLQTLNGKQALMLCRSRHAYDQYGDGDRYRAANQRLVLGAIAKKLLNSDIPTITSTISAIADYVTTDYSVPDAVGLAVCMRGLDPSKDIYTAMEPTTSEMIDGVWYEHLNEAEWKTMMERVDKGLPPTENTVVDETGSVLESNGDGSTAAKYGTGEIKPGVNKAPAQSSNLNHDGLVVVKNGCGRDGVAGAAGAEIEALGWKVETGAADDYEYKRTLIVYDDLERADEAEEIAATIGCGRVIKNDGTYNVGGDLLVVIGPDYQ
ncbi:MAG: LCP family protein [Coriobacteriia bacterium]|nr:LCP family protein [Coriobacteriia bacterium]